MADGIVLNAGSAGDTVSADDLGSFKVQRVKMQYGPDGSATDVSLGTPMPITNFALQASAGNVSGVSFVRKFGANAAVGTTAEEIWSPGGTYTGWLTSAEPVRIRAGGNANDDATGTGVRSITVEGLDDSWDEASASIITAGASASSNTTTDFFRIFRAYATNTGTYGGSNAGNILIEGATSGNLLAQIDADVGQTEMAIYTIPNGKTGYLAGVSVSVDSSKSMDVFLYQRPSADIVAAPFGPKRLITKATGVSGSSIGRDLPVYPSFAAKTDIWASAVIDTGTGEIEATFYLLLVDD